MLQPADSDNFTQMIKHISVQLLEGSSAHEALRCYSLVYFACCL